VFEDKRTRRNQRLIDLYHTALLRDPDRMTSLLRKQTRRMCSGRWCSSPNSSSSTDMNRRDFLRRVSAPPLAALAAGRHRARFWHQQTAAPKPTADTVNPPLDGRRDGSYRDVRPEAYAPFVKGMPVASMLSTFESRPTALDGIRDSREGLEGDRPGARSRHTHSLARSRQTSERSSTHRINITGTPATSRPRASQRRISARGSRRNLVHAILSCRRSSSSASGSIAAKRRS
jgi:hypothetical protein